MIRAFEPRDYDALADVAAAIDPQTNTTAEWLRQRDRTHDPAHFRCRMVAEHDGRVVGWGQVGHMWWAFHPHKVSLRLNVHPAFQGRGFGAALYDALLAAVAPLQPLTVQTDTRAGRDHAIRFLEHRGFVELRRRWESRLRLDSVRTDRQAVFPPGIRVTTYAEELGRRGDRLVRDVFELEEAAGSTEPGYDPDAAMSFDQFVANELAADSTMLDAYFLALDGERLVGVSRLQRESARPDVVHVGFTGTHPDYRGRGIAFALKLLTIDYARQHGIREIRTQNDTRNEPMLHINQSVGFVTEPPWIVYERRFDGQ